MHSLCRVRIVPIVLPYIRRVSNCWTLECVSMQVVGCRQLFLRDSDRKQRNQMIEKCVNYKIIDG